jgi:hypothetical protein
LTNTKLIFEITAKENKSEIDFADERLFLNQDVVHDVQMKDGL